MLLPLSAQEADEQAVGAAASTSAATSTSASAEVSTAAPIEIGSEPETVQEAPIVLDDDAKTKSSGNGWLLSLSLALSVLGLALGALAFHQARRNRRDLDRLLSEGIMMTVEQETKKPVVQQPATTPVAKTQATYNKPRETRQTREPRRELERRQPAQPQTFFLSRPDDSDCFQRVTTEFEPGNSIFRLDTTDGVNGTFTVIDNPDVHRFALMMPTQNLTRACSGNAIQVSDGKRRIVTDRAGKASLENGVWHITVKAIIHYE